MRKNAPTSAPPGSLPAEPYIEKKITMHPEWPSFNTPRGRAIRYGAACCPRTLELRNRALYIPIGPKYSEGDCGDIVAAMRKVHRALVG